MKPIKKEVPKRQGKRFWKYQGEDVILDVREKKTVIYALVNFTTIPVVIVHSVNPRAVKEAARMVIGLVKIERELKARGRVVNPLFEVEPVKTEGT